MPILHPDPPRIPTPLAAAREVLAALRGLPEEAHLFVRARVPEREGAACDLDFLVLHPELGVVIVVVGAPEAEASAPEAPPQAPEPAPEAVPEAAPEAATDAVLEAASEAVPEAAPEAVLEAASEIMPDAAPEPPVPPAPAVAPAEAAPAAVPGADAAVALAQELTRAQYQLQNLLKQAGAPVPRITRVLALPGLPLKPGQSLGPELPAWRILTRDKLRRPFAALGEAVAGGRPWTNWRSLDRASHPTLGPEPFQALLGQLVPLLLPQLALEELLAGDGGGRDAEAQPPLDHLAHNFSQGRYRVRGAAGSGKSLLGRKVARLWAAEGRSVLLLVAGAGQAAIAAGALEPLVQQGQVVVRTFRDLALDLLDEARISAPAGADLAAALAAAVPAYRSRWTALVLDDAQDLDPGWAAPLFGLLQAPDADPFLVLEAPVPGRASRTLAGQLWQLDLRAEP